MNRDMARRPCLFESSLLSLKLFDGCTSASKMNFTKEPFWVQMHNFPIVCMNEDMETFIGTTIGEVKRCDVQNDGMAWGRVLIEIDLLKPITRGQTLNIKGLKT